jgi:hypothetical protein
MTNPMPACGFNEACSCNKAPCPILATFFRRKGGKPQPSTNTNVKTNINTNKIMRNQPHD